MIEQQAVDSPAAPPRPGRRPTDGATDGHPAPAGRRDDGHRQYREIAGRLLLLDRPAAPWLIGVTSALHGEGASTTAYGLATALALALPERIALVEFTLARPALAAELGAPATPGLAEVVQQGAPLLAASRPTALPNLFAVPAGQLDGDLGRFVHDPRLQDLWPALDGLGEIVVCDLPPVLADSATVFLARRLTTLLLTVRAGATPAPLVAEALDRLGRARVAGVVLNGEARRLPGWLRRLLGES